MNVLIGCEFSGIVREEYIIESGTVDGDFYAEAHHANATECYLVRI